MTRKRPRTARTSDRAGVWRPARAKESVYHQRLEGAPLRRAVQPQRSHARASGEIPAQRGRNDAVPF